MLKGTLILLANSLGLIGVVVLALRVLIFTYLEVVNGYEAWPYFRRTIESMLYYDKKVRPKDEWLKKLCNALLKIGWFAIGLAIIFFVLVVWLSN